MAYAVGQNRNLAPVADNGARLFLGVDVGGTFTDLVFYDAVGLMRCVKVPTVPDQPGVSTLAGIDEIRTSESAEQLSGWQDLSHTHSSTIATNALIERSGPQIGLITTSGFRDIMDFQRLNLPHPMRYDSRRPQPLVERRHVKEVRERTDADGQVLEVVMQDDVINAAEHFRAAGISDIVICFLHSYRNPENERRAAEILREQLPDSRVDISSDIWPQAREYERATLACINALVRPAIERYLDELTEGLGSRDIHSQPRVARSNGGSEGTHSLRVRPANALLSGPAAGVAGAAVAAVQAGWVGADLLTLDVGGTSADIGVIRNANVLLSSEERVGDFPILLPSVAVSSIGAGGGSVIWLDEQGGLRVGPTSVGSFPGPACYGRLSQGTPALTDAFVEVGLIGDGRALGGKIQVKGELAHGALLRLGAIRSWSATDVGDWAIQIAVAKMVAEATRVLARRGIDAPQFRMVAYGGAGPLLAALVAQEINVGEILVPHKPGALSAMGAAHADLEGDLIVPVYTKVDQLSSATLIALGARLTEAVRAWLASQREMVDIDAVTIRFSCDMRYDGQGFDVEVPLDETILAAGDVDRMAAIFHARHRATYGHADESGLVWCKELRAHVIGLLAKPVLSGFVDQDAVNLSPTREMRLSGSTASVPVVARTKLKSESWLDGPVVIEQLDTTTYVPPGWKLFCHETGHLLLERRG